VHVVGAEACANTVKLIVPPGDVPELRVAVTALAGIAIPTVPEPGAVTESAGETFGVVIGPAEAEGPVHGAEPIVGVIENV
jgi:hypothetical protein